VKEFLGDNDIGLFKHPERNTVEEEIKALRKSYAYERALKQFNKNKRLGFKDDQGLYECGVLVIRHNEKTKSFCIDWWKQILENPRDQVSFPYILSKHNIKIKANTGNVGRHKWFQFQ